MHIPGLLCISVSPSESDCITPLKRIKVATHTHTQIRARHCITTHAQARAIPHPPLPHCLLFIMHHELTPPVGTEEAETRQTFLRTPRLRWPDPRETAAKLRCQKISVRSDLCRFGQGAQKMGRFMCAPAIYLKTNVTFFRIKVWMGGHKRVVKEIKQHLFLMYK